MILTVPVRLHHMEFVSVRVSKRTEWTFAEITDDCGSTAIVEITHDNADAVSRMIEIMQRLGTTLWGRSVADEALVPNVLGVTSPQLRSDLALATAISAFRTAVVDIQSQHAGLGLTEALGGRLEDSVLLYANINRALIENRTPTAFGTAAERAVRKGFTIVKCAPFDEVQPGRVDEVFEMAHPGLERVAAVRAAIGPEVKLLVDCHFRFELDTAPIIAEELARFDVNWFEEPLNPLRDAGMLARLAKKVTIPLAGLEFSYGEEPFRAMLQRNALSIVMPDIKHCGGATEAYHIGKVARQLGGQVSLHNPTGPISQLASAYVTAAIPGAFALEHCFGETSWRSELLLPHERIDEGHFWFPDDKGLGTKLNPDIVAEYGRRWKS